MSLRCKEVGYLRSTVAAQLYHDIIKRWRKSVRELVVGRNFADVWEDYPGRGRDVKGVLRLVVKDGQILFCSQFEGKKKKMK